MMRGSGRSKRRPYNLAEVFEAILYGLKNVASQKIMNLAQTKAPGGLNLWPPGAGRSRAAAHGRRHCLHYSIWISQRR
jgi:hypothetical protein